MARQLHAPGPAPLFLMAEIPTNPAWPALVPAPLPMDIPNNHFDYALTWFGLAAALACVYVADLVGRNFPAEVVTGSAMKIQQAESSAICRANRWRRRKA